MTGERTSQRTRLFTGLALVLSLSVPSASAEPCSRLVRFLRAEALVREAQVLTGSATDKLSGPAFAIFDRVNRDPAYEPSPDDLAVLKGEGIEPVFDRYRQAGRWVQKLNEQLGLWYRSQPAKPKLKGVQRVLRAWKLVVPILPDVAKIRARVIYGKVLENPSLVLTPGDAKFIKRWNLTSDLERFRQDLKIRRPDFVTLSKVRRAGSYLAWSIALSGAAIGLIGNRYISSQQSFDEDDKDGMSKYDDKVELIFFAPAPHAAVRIGGLVYNYGVMRVDRYDLGQLKTMIGFGKAASGSQTRVELKLTDDERARLQDYLEADVGRVYPLMIPFNDCVSQSNKALNAAVPGLKPPPVLDRSQIGSLAYYKLLKFFGSKRVGAIRFAARDGQTLTQKGLDAAVNVVDALFFIRRAGTVIMVAPVLDRIPTTFEVKHPDSARSGP